MARKLLAAYEKVVEPLELQDREMLRQRAQMLKGIDGESWAIGEMVERACSLLDKLGKLEREK